MSISFSCSSISTFSTSSSSSSSSFTSFSSPPHLPCLDYPSSSTPIANLLSNVMHFNPILGLIQINSAALTISQAISGRGISECQSLLCDQLACVNGGTCISNSTHAWCECPTGISDYRCRDICASARHLCQNGATCCPNASSVLLYTCACPPSQTGMFCNQSKFLHMVFGAAILFLCERLRVTVMRCGLACS